MKLTIDQRIIIGFLVLITIYGVSGFISVRNLVESKEITTRNSSIIQPSIILLNDFELMIVSSKNYTSSWIINDISDHKDKKKLIEIHSKEYPLLKKQLLAISEKWRNMKNKSLLDSIIATYETVIIYQKKIMNSLNSIDAYQDYLLRVTAEDDYMEKVNIGIDKTLNLHSNLLKNLKVESTNEEETMVKSFASIKLTNILLTLLSVFISLIVAFVTFRSVKLEEQKKEITEERNLSQSQKAILAEKNKEITDSINYAKRIQQSILPSDETIKHYFPDHFIFYKPRDIVSGDFYWFKEFDKETVLIAAADSTGHGVPGAFVSFVCNSSLNRVITEFGISTPGKILDKTSELVQSAFAEYGENDVQDGMDIALCSFKKTAEGKQLQYSGANNSACLIKNGETIVLTATRKPIGASSKEESFETHIHELKHGDTVYLFSDGFLDQFGGPKNKKYKSKNFFELLSKIALEDIKNQKSFLEKELDRWIGNNSQIDDILIIGIKV